MSEFLATAVLIILFIIRFAMPFIITLSVAFALDRLQNRWADESGTGSGGILVN